MLLVELQEIHCKYVDFLLTGNFKRGNQGRILLFNSIIDRSWINIAIAAV
jgi:hypothetical protein